MNTNRIFGTSLVILMALIIVSCNVSNDKTLRNMSPREIAKELIADIFTISYDDAVREYEYRHKESPSEEDIDRVDYIYRDDIFRKYFSEEGYKVFRNKTYNLIYHTYIREHEFDIAIKSIALDMRNTSNENTKVCYFSVEYELVFLDEEIESIAMSTDGEMTLKKDSETWFVHYVNLKIKQLDLD